ncbi:MAG: hypothetical protein IJF54_03635 [Clostridia bacterium]|nr:hypothetical protein [Clostridia bacterium]
MKKCLNCNTSLADDVNVCPSCGSEELSETVRTGGRKSNSKTKRIVISAIALVLCIVCVGYIYFAKVVPSQPVENSVEAIYEGNFQKHLENIPPDVRENERSLFSQKYLNEEEFKTQAQSQLEGNLGKNVSAKVKVLETQRLSGDALVRLQQEMRQYISSEIQDAAYITVKITLTGDDNEVVTSKTIVSLKMNGKWYAQNSLFGLTAQN